MLFKIIYYTKLIPSFFYILLLQPLIVLWTLNIANNPLLKGDEKFGQIILISAIAPQLVYFVFILFFISYLNKLQLIFFKKLLYFTFFFYFIFTFLLLLFAIIGYESVDEQYGFFAIIPSLYIYPGMILMLILGFDIILHKKYYLLKQYKYIVLFIISEIIVHGFYYNKGFYELYLYLVPLPFALIQLYIEAYYFYKKEKPKWVRYNRLKKYKQTKKLKYEN